MDKIIHFNKNWKTKITNIETEEEK